MFHRTSQTLLKLQLQQAKNALILGWSFLKTSSINNLAFFLTEIHSNTFTPAQCLIEHRKTLTVLVTSHCKESCFCDFPALHTATEIPQCPHFPGATMSDISPPLLLKLLKEAPVCIPYHGKSDMSTWNLPAHSVCRMFASIDHQWRTFPTILSMFCTYGMYGTHEVCSCVRMHVSCLNWLSPCAVNGLLLCDDAVWNLLSKQ